MALEDCPSSVEPTIFLTLYNNEQGAITRNTYYHMNWGWYGNNNGLFIDSSNSVGGYNFNVDRVDIINIFPSI